MSALPDDCPDLSMWADMIGDGPVDLAQIGADVLDAIRVGIDNHPRSAQIEIGPSEIGHPCLAGDTEVVTRQGIRRIRDLAKEGSAELLVPLLYKGSDVRKRWGRFERVPVEQFGEQETYEITLRRDRDTKAVVATAGHHWFRSYWLGKRRAQERLDTLSLRPGHRLTSLRRSRPLTTTQMPVAVAQGFVFGDGTKGSDDDRHRPATLNLYHNGKDEALLPYFPGEHAVYRRPTHAHACSYITGLPRFWKHLPPLDESTSFLMSWLAGYFAADGCVTQDGTCFISSAYEAHLRFVQSAAAICGIGYGQVHSYMRRGISGNEPAAEETPLYELTLRLRDLPQWFFLTTRHAERAQAAKSRSERPERRWVVESVRATGRTEPVYCAVTGAPEAFALADDLMTGNCNRWLAHRLAGTRPTGLQVPPWRQAVGTAVHDQFDLWLDHANHTRGVRYLFNLRVMVGELYPGRAITGRLDGLDLATATVIDLKVPGPTSMRAHQPPKPESPQYDVQLDLYGQGARNAGFPVRTVGILRVPAAGELTDAIWSPRPHDPDRADAALARAGGIARMVDALGPKAIPLQPTAAHYCNRCDYFAPGATDLTVGCPGDPTWAAARDSRPDPLASLIA